MDVLAAVSALTGMDLQPRGRLVGGEQTGAGLVADETGRLLVIKRETIPWKAERLLKAAPAMEFATARGWPAARWLWVGRLTDESVVVVQQHLAGVPVTQLGHGTMEAILTANDRQAGLGCPDAFDDSAQLAAVLHGDCAWKAAVADNTRAGADLIHSGEALLSSSGSPSLPVTDVVHGDYSSSNMIFTGSGIGFVDCATVGRGTRVRDLADLYRQCFIYPGTPATAVSLLRTRAVAIAGAQVFIACVIAVTYNNLAWWAENKSRSDFDQACRRAQVLFDSCRTLRH